MSTDTVIGEPIHVLEDTVIIPISKVSVGFTSGGVDFDSKKSNDTKHFGGGNGAGMSVTPVGFLVCSHGDVKLISLPGKQEGSTDNLVDSITELLEKSPAIIEKLKNLFKKDKAPEETEQT